MGKGCKERERGRERKEGGGETHRKNKCRYFTFPQNNKYVRFVNFTFNAVVAVKKKDSQEGGWRG